MKITTKKIIKKIKFIVLVFVMILFTHPYKWRYEYEKLKN